MTSSTRVPTAETTGVYGAVLKKISRKMFGEAPELPPPSRTACCPSRQLSWSRGGVSAAAALASATVLAAAADGLGTARAGCGPRSDADLLVADSDPVADIAALARPTAVFAGGRRPAGAV